MVLGYLSLGNRHCCTADSETAAHLSLSRALGAWLLLIEHLLVSWRMHHHHHQYMLNESAGADKFPQLTLLAHTDAGQRADTDTCTQKQALTKSALQPYPGNTVCLLTRLLPFLVWSAV